MSTQSLAVAEGILKSFQVLPTVPAAASRAIQLLNEPDADMSEVADIILSDQVIAARVIRIINSPLYQLIREIDSVKQALIYLGPQKIFEIILTSCFLELTNANNQRGMRIQSCWEHSFGVALVARKLAEMSAKVLPEKAYVAGILHDIGEVILSQQRHDDFLKAMDIANQKEIVIYDAEMEVFGASHAEVGALLAEQWRFPEMLIEVIQYHHDEHIEQRSILTQIVALADMICTDVRLTCDYQGPDSDVGGRVFGANLKSLEHQLSALGVTNLCAFRDTLGQIMEQVKEAVRQIYG